MDSLDIKDYCQQLTQICGVCRSEAKCKDHTKICFLKKLAFSMAKRRFKRREKVGV